MDVFIMVRRKSMTIFLDAKENSPILEIKKMIAGITKVSPENQKLYYNDALMDDNKYLIDYGLDSLTAKAQSPSTIGLVYRDVNSSDPDQFETLEITPLSLPPELPDSMKPDTNEVN